MSKKTRPPSLITADDIVAQYANKLESLTQRMRALWAADCAERVLHYFEKERPKDDRPRQAIEGARAWTRGDISMMDARKLAVAAHAAARACKQPSATAAARATGHAVATAHAKGHARGGASYALLAIALGEPEKAAMRMSAEKKWQKSKLGKYKKKRAVATLRAARVRAARR
jgi:immunity protein 5 of polymorphic toxin system